MGRNRPRTEAFLLALGDAGGDKGPKDGTDKVDMRVVETIGDKMASSGIPSLLFPPLLVVGLVRLLSITSPSLETIVVVVVDMLTTLRSVAVAANELLLSGGGGELGGVKGASGGSDTKDRRRSVVGGDTGRMICVDSEGTVTGEGGRGEEGMEGGRGVDSTVGDTGGRLGDKRGNKRGGSIAADAAAASMVDRL